MKHFSTLAKALAATTGLFVVSTLLVACVSAEKFSEPTEQNNELVEYIPIETVAPTTEPTPTEPMPTEHIHAYSQQIIEPSCTEGGYTEHTCECGDTYRDSDTPIIEHSYVVIETVDPTCTEGGYSVYECEMCKDIYTDDVVAKLEHKYHSNVIQPTTESQGYTQHICELCGDEYKDNYKDKLPTVKYTTTDEYLYTTAENLNVRVGPGTQYDKVKSLPQNTKVHRVAKGDNNWSKIELDGEILYVSSNYLSKDKVEPPKKETVAEEMARRGNIGRLTIPSVGVDVALFKASLYGGAQVAVDASDSAAYMEDAINYYGFILIGDHRHQGFDKMKSSIPGSTKAYIDFGTHTKTYICTDKFKGRNITTDLVTLDGEKIVGKNPGGVCMYTCNTDDTVTITFWQPAD